MRGAPVAPVAPVAPAVRAAPAQVASRSGCRRLRGSGAAAGATTARHPAARDHAADDQPTARRPVDASGPVEGSADELPGYRAMQSVPAADRLGCGPSRAVGLEGDGRVAPGLLGRAALAADVPRHGVARPLLGLAYSTARGDPRPVGRMSVRGAAHARGSDAGTQGNEGWRAPVTPADARTPRIGAAARARAGGNARKRLHRCTDSGKRSDGTRGRQAIVEQFARPLRPGPAAVMTVA